MKKYAYLAKLEALLAGLPEQERDDALAYYEEYIDAAGKENEEQTIAALGSPEEVAQKILEGEGLTATAENAAAGSSAGGGVPNAPQGAAASESAGAPAAPQAEPASAPAAPADTAAPSAQPKGPEPPPAFAAAEPAPASYTPGARSTAKGFHPFQNPPRPFSRRGWIVFVCVIAIALIVQLAVLAVHFTGRSRRTVRDEVAVAVPDIDSGYAVDRGSETAPGTAHEEAAVTDSTGSYDTAEHDDHAVDHGSAPIVITGDGTTFYDSEVQEIELHLTAANLSIAGSDVADQELQLQIAGAGASEFDVSYVQDDGRTKMVVRDGRRNVLDPGEATVTLVLPQNFREIEAHAVTGNVTLESLMISEVEVEVGTGDITAQDLAAGKLDLKTGTGDVYAYGITPARSEHEIDLQTATGNIAATLNAASDDYEYEIGARQGTIRVDGKVYDSGLKTRSGRYELEAVTGTGDIDITFAP